jgi:hypothetical protein
MKLRRKNGQQRVVMYSSAWAICPQWQQATMVLNMTATGLYYNDCPLQMWQCVASAFPKCGCVLGHKFSDCNSLLATHAACIHAIHGVNSSLLQKRSASGCCTCMRSSRPGRPCDCSMPLLLSDTITPSKPPPPPYNTAPSRPKLDLPAAHTPLALCQAALHLAADPVTGC